MRRYALYCSIATAIATKALAYGPIGHQIVGAVADRRLANTPAGAKVASLIDGFSLEKAAVIADEIKGWDKRGADDPAIFHYTAHPMIDAQLREFWKANPPTKDRKCPIPSHHWFHYTDVPLARPELYADGSAGRSQWDIVHMTAFAIKVLRREVPEENERKITRPVAVILLAHYLGDIHQPLHVGAEYFGKGGEVVDADNAADALEDQGGNSFTLSLHSRVPFGGNHNSKLHGFWDTDCVMANLPALPETMPKEERRAKMDEARRELVDRLSKQEPEKWRIPSASARGYAEALANEILPLAREAHQRLHFRDVRQQQDESGAVFAAGIAEDRPEDSPSYAEWSRKVVADELHKAGWRLADLLSEAVE